MTGPATKTNYAMPFIEQPSTVTALSSGPVICAPVVSFGPVQKTPPQKKRHTGTILHPGADGLMFSTHEVVNYKCLIARHHSLSEIDCNRLLIC